MKRRKHTRPIAQTVPPAPQSADATETDWQARQCARDEAPYVPNGNRLFSIWADDGSDKGKRQVAWVQDWSRMRD